MAKKFIKFYKHENWHKYSEEVKARDGYCCTKCQRSAEEVNLHAHHTYYVSGQKPWEYPLEACVTLCAGCHAREHDLIEPTNEWILIDINDLEDLSGKCEKIGCGKNIRYEFNIYHPNWGYKIVGSTCVDYLSAEDQTIARYLLNYYTSISTFLADNMAVKRTEKTKRILFKQQSYKHSFINFYEMKDGYKFKVYIRTGPRKYTPKESVEVKNGCSLNKVRALGFLALNGHLEKDKKKLDAIRSVYKEIYKNPRF